MEERKRVYESLGLESSKFVVLEYRILLLSPISLRAQAFVVVSRANTKNVINAWFSGRKTPLSPFVFQILPAVAAGHNANFLGESVHARP